MVLLTLGLASLLLDVICGMIQSDVNWFTLASEMFKIHGCADKPETWIRVRFKKLSLVRCPHLQTGRDGIERVLPPLCKTDEV